MSFTNIVRCTTLLALLTAAYGMAVPNATRQVLQLSSQGITFGSVQLTPFQELEGINPRGRSSGSFAINRLQLLQSRTSPISLGFYAAQLTRAQSTGHFLPIVYTPTNSRGFIRFFSVDNAIRMRLELSSTVRRPTFVYEGIVNVAAGASPTASNLQIDQIESITFQSAEESSVGGTFRQVPIARRTTSPQSSAALLRIDSQPVPLSTSPPSPLASSSLPGRKPSYAADNNRFRSFRSRPELNPYFTIATATGRQPIQLISLTATNPNTFALHGVRVFVGDCVFEPPNLPSQIIRYLNDRISYRDLLPCAGSAQLRPAFECEAIQPVRGFPLEVVEYYCGANRQSYGFLYVTTNPGVTANRELGISEITASRNA